MISLSVRSLILGHLNRFKEFDYAQKSDSVADQSFPAAMSSAAEPKKETGQKGPK